MRPRRTLAMAGIVAAALLALTAGALWWIGAVAVRRETGYLTSIFTPDGASIVVITRDVRALVTGLGREFFTGPATVRLQRDHFELLSIRVSDRRTTVLESLPPSPLVGDSIQAHHGAIFGVAHAHLRWADATHLDYEIAVTRHDAPVARTFVNRRVWNQKTGKYVTTRPWQEASTSMSGDEPQQIHGDLEAIAVPGDELMPCAIVLLRRDGSAATPLVETPTCRRKHPEGISPAVLAPLSRRAAIERDEKIRTTYADLVARGRASGLIESQAMLEAGREMQRLGLYPKTATIEATASSCDTASPVFHVSDDEFRYGLFPDIEAAIAKPGVAVDKSMGTYITHRDYTTSRKLNEYLDGGHSIVFVRTRGGCWRLSIQRP